LTPISPQHQYGMSMEHLDSSTYYLAASASLTTASTPDDEARVLYNFAHHISHAWVPKRVYSEGYFPFQWELAPVLDSIWFAEGLRPVRRHHGDRAGRCPIRPPIDRAC
jgi:predicted metalloprotease with PDZ domain